MKRIQVMTHDGTMPMKHKGALVAIFVSLLMILCLGLPTPSHAAAGSVVYKNATGSSGPNSSIILSNCATVSYTAGANVGISCFDPSGDVMYVKDNASDGYHIEMRAQGNNGVGYVCRSYVGAGNGWSACHFGTQMPENTQLILNTVVANGSQLLNVSFKTLLLTS